VGDPDSIGRRELLKTLAASGFALVPTGLLLGRAAHAMERTASSKTLRVWVFSDAHVGRDQQYGNGRESLATALRQSESTSGFDWDIALDLGDLCGDVGLPKNAEGAEIVRQFGVLKKHRREQIYDLSGNHDRSGPDEPQAWWWRKWVDPTG
jgi:metallophosphoesterase superfamily enzyme